MASTYTAFEEQDTGNCGRQVTDECSDGQDRYGRIVKDGKRQLSRQNGKGLPQNTASCSWKEKEDGYVCFFADIRLKRIILG